jgi:DNA-binding GntR family transcriptional regulator
MVNASGASQRQEVSQLPTGAYIAIRDEILSGQLAPGEPLSEYSLARELDMSRTPVRTALTRLEGDGLVERLPGKGYFVSQLLPRQVAEVYQLREALECFSLREAGTRIEDRLLEKLEVFFRHFSQIDRALTLEEWRLLYLGDRRFHRQTVATLRNKTLEEAVDKLELQITRALGISWSLTERHLVSTEQHLGIVVALRGGDVREACDLLAAHLRHSRDFVLEALANHRTEPIGMLLDPSDPKVDRWLDDPAIDGEQFAELLAELVPHTVDQPS